MEPKPQDHFNNLLKPYTLHGIQDETFKYLELCKECEVELTPKTGNLNGFCVQCAREVYD